MKSSNHRIKHHDESIIIIIREGEREPDHPLCIVMSSSSPKTLDEA